jgi:hypothetical protein
VWVYVHPHIKHTNTHNFASHQQSTYHTTQQSNHSLYTTDTTQTKLSNKALFHSHSFLLAPRLLHEAYQSINSFDRFWPLMGADIDFSVPPLQWLPRKPCGGGYIAYQM